MKYEDLTVGVKAPYKEIKQFFGEELTFNELVYVPGTEKLLILMLCTVNGIEEDDDIYVGQITRVVDNEEGYEEYASVILDIPGYDQKPICIDSDDMEVPQLDEDDDPEIISNCYARIWRIRKPLPALEQLAIGAAAYGKCKSNLIETTEDLLEAFRTGAIKNVLKSYAIRSVKQVLTVAGIQIPEEEPKQETAIVAAQPAEIDAVDKAKQLHQRILADAQSAAESIWDMSQAIKEMRDGKHYKALLYDNFEGYCEEALGMSRSHAYRYIQIAEGMNAENVSQLAQIGTTKLALLASVTEEQREIVTTAVDVESATVKELKAEIDKLQGKVKQAEQEKLAAENMQSIERAHRKESDAAFERAQSRIRVLEAEKQQNADRKELLDAADNQIRRLNAEIANNSDYIAKLQEKITDLENRPVEVAVQEDSEALEQIRKEYEAKLHDQEAEIRKLEDELNDKDDNAYFTKLDIYYREARVKVQSICTMVANLGECKEKDTLKKNLRNIISDIEQRIGKE